MNKIILICGLFSVRQAPKNHFPSDKPPKTIFRPTSPQNHFPSDKPQKKTFSVRQGKVSSLILKQQMYMIENISKILLGITACKIDFWQYPVSHFQYYQTIHTVVRHFLFCDIFFSSMCELHLDCTACPTRNRRNQTYKVLIKCVDLLHLLAVIW